jgi:hypothetical protein
MSKINIKSIIIAVSITALAITSFPATVLAAELTQTDLASKSITCDIGIADSLVTCQFAISSSDSLPPQLKLGIGNGLPSGFCISTSTQATCSGVLVGDNGDTKIYAKIGSSSKFQTLGNSSSYLFDLNGDGNVNELDNISNTITVATSNVQTQTFGIEQDPIAGTDNTAQTTSNSAPVKQINISNNNSNTQSTSPAQANQNTQLPLATQNTTTGTQNTTSLGNSYTVTNALVRTGGFSYASGLAILSLLLILLIKMKAKFE